jgi:hypothetical protein
MRMTMMMVASAAMANVRRIHQYLDRKRAAEKKQNGQPQRETSASQPMGAALSAFLPSLRGSWSLFWDFPVTCFDC